MNFQYCLALIIGMQASALIKTNDRTTRVIFYLAAVLFAFAGNGK